MPWYRFWIKSNRGTDSYGYRFLPCDNTKKNKGEIRDALEDWCSGFGAWDHGENVVTYGYSRVKFPPKKVLEKKAEGAAWRVKSARSELVFLRGQLKQALKAKKNKK